MDEQYTETGALVAVMDGNIVMATELVRTLNQFELREFARALFKLRQIVDARCQVVYTVQRSEAAHAKEQRRLEENQPPG